MALWQFDIEVIPKERVRNRIEVDVAEFDTARWWSDRQPPSNFRERLSTLLPAAKSWHQELLWFGVDDSDRIDVWMESNRVESIGVRIDCRKSNVGFAKGLLTLAQDWFCELVEKRYRKVLPATLEAFVAAVADSPSCRFMEDPGYWLPKLAAEVEAAERFDH